MDVVTTSLEALIQRVTNPQNQKPDVAATEAFCVMLTKETEGIQIGIKLLAQQIQSSNESEALQALALLDTCMQRCGPSFHAEVGKFRFLNEMIRLVSPKYLGNTTPAAVRQKVLQILHAWTKEYPRELKIKEAYEMLKKQGVVEEDTSSVNSTTEDAQKAAKVKNTIFDDEEKSKLLQKLLQSKNPVDLQAANRLIKTMVREDERRAQLNSRRIMELESVHNNAKLLSEMLDSFNRNETSSEDLDLMKELYQACERLKRMVLRLAGEAQDNEEMLGDVLAASDELSLVFDKYTAIIIRGESAKVSRIEPNVGPSLLDLSSPTETVSFESGGLSTTPTNHRSDMEVLGDIFNSIGKSPEMSSISGPSLLMPDSVIMQPISILPVNKKGEIADTPEKKLDSKARALEELNELGESLLKQSLSNTILNPRSNPGSKQTTNHTLKVEPLAEVYGSTTTFRSSSNSNPLDVSEAKNGTFSNNLESLDDRNPPINASNSTYETLNYDGHSKTSSKPNDRLIVPENDPTSSTSTGNAIEMEIKPLTDINVSLQNIKPGTTPPLTVIEEKNGISVVLHFARDNPRPDVFVVVITTMSKNSKPLCNYLFQAVVPKKCKCRLQPPSGTELPGHNPFLPPSAITQIMLVANPNKEPVSLKFMLSYTMDDETFTEMGDVETLPNPLS